MKLSAGFTRLYPSILVFVCYGISFSVFMFALKHFDLSFAYAIWAGLGIMLVSAVGMLFFKEPVNWLKIVAIGVIICGVVTLNLSEMMVTSPSRDTHVDRSNAKVP
jgi:small multidrug resistance pump